MEPFRKPFVSAMGRVKKVFMWIGGVMVGLVLLGLVMEQDKPTPDPVPAPAPAPASAPGPTPTVAAPAPNLGGLWHSRSGESYAFEQQGNNLAFSILVGGNTVGQGSGSVEAGSASLLMDVLFGGQQVSLVCQLQLASDQRLMTGTCMNSLNGQATPAQIFR